MTKLSKPVTRLAAGAASLALLGAAGVANAETTKLRIQTHFTPEQLSGEMAKEYVENITRCRQRHSRL